MIGETALAISHAYEVSQQKEKCLTDLGLVALDITLTALGVRANAKDFFVAAQRAQAGLKKAEPFLLKGKQELGDALEAKSRLHPALPTLQVLQETCFAGSTPILTPAGSKRIDELQEGDLVLSRSEHDVTGLVQARKIERLFKLANTIWEVRVSGQILETTSEHPFWVQEKGWVKARELSAGDLLLGHDGSSSVVESVNITERNDHVYNLRVEADHTFFVGDESWGFSVWVHNTYKATKLADGTVELVDDVTGKRTVFANESDFLQFYTTTSGSKIPFQSINDAVSYLNAPGSGTIPTGVLNGTPTGQPRKVKYNDPDTKNILATLSENYVADILAKAGYRVERNPPRAPGIASRPDLMIEGRYFDTKTPIGSGVRSFVDNNIADKIHQSGGRFVVPLHHSTFSLDDLTKQLKDYPVPGLKEIFVILKDDTIVKIVL